MSDIERRTGKVQRDLSRRGLDAFLVSSIRNIRYLTGFTGSSAFLIITRHHRLFFTDFRYREQAQKEVRGWDITIEKGRRVQTIRATLRRLGIGSLGFETTSSYDFYASLKRLGATLSPVKGLIERFRKVKSDLELSSITEAVRRAEKAFLRIMPMIRVGTTERAVALRLEEQLRREGCRHPAFDIIVASGGNASMPHAKTTDKEIEKGDFVIIDWGGEADGYYSDMTRTLLVAGRGLSEKRRIYETVNAAREKAISSVREGARARDIDRAARAIIEEAGYGDLFGHGTGHGVGLDVHEDPRISWTNPERVSEGMVFTVEPGIYQPGTGGVRIEDMVTLSEGSPRLLTTLPRELAIIRS